MDRKIKKHLDDWIEVRRYGHNQLIQYKQSQKK